MYTTQPKSRIKPTIMQLGKSRIDTNRKGSRDRNSLQYVKQNSRAPDRMQHNTRNWKSSHHKIRLGRNVQERIKAILIGVVSGRVDETLKDDEVSVYDEGTKEYIESNRLLDYIAEFLWKANVKADRPVLVSGLNETKPTLNYDNRYGGKVKTREYKTDQYKRDRQ